MTIAVEQHAGSAGTADFETAPLRRIWVCADDYGISPAVNAAIRDLITRGRINATSVMVAAPSFHRAEAIALRMLNAGGRRAAIGLHITLTEPFRPLSEQFQPLHEGAFLPIERMLWRGTLRLLRRKALAREISAQLKTFVELFGHAPDFIDGHQHVHLVPQVREALLRTVKEQAPQAWVRQCGRASPLMRRLTGRKALLLDVLSRKFRARATRVGVATNPAFAGAYDFTAAEADYASLFETFLDRMPPNGVIMCHPGFVDAELARLDPFTRQREREYAFFAGESFPGLLRSRGVALA
jgi:predicted glycoside hydrolase/deacetylase ChbG (UPF0249 family)